MPHTRFIHGFPQRPTAIFTFLIFILHTLFLPAPNVYAGKILNPSIEAKEINISKKFQSLDQLELPKEFGTIEDRGWGIENGKNNLDFLTSNLQPPTPTIILVQDAHAIGDAQRSIKNIVEYFKTDYGVSLVGLEGSSEKLDTTLLNTYPSKTKLNKFLDELLVHGELSGAVAAAFMGSDTVDFFGVEDQNLYEEGVDLFLKVHRENATLLEKLKKEEDVLNQTKQKIYSSELLAFDRKVQAWEKRELDLIEFLSGVKHHGTWHQYPKLSAVMESLFLEESKHLPVLEREVAALFSQIAQESSTENLYLLNAKRQAYETGEISLAEYAASLVGVGEWAALSWSEPRLRRGVEGGSVSSELKSLIQQHKTLESIRGEEFYLEIEQFIQAVKESLFENEEQRVLDRKSRENILLQKLAKLELSRKEWIELGYRGWGIGDSYFEFHKRFYENAIRREKTLFQNLSKRFHSPPSIPRRRRGPLQILSEVRSKESDSLQERAAHSQHRAAMLIAGGFHTEGLKEEIKKAGMNYVVISPRIEEIPENVSYLDYMRGNVSWKDYFEVKNGRIDLWDAFMQLAVEQLTAQIKRGSGTRISHGSGSVFDPSRRSAFDLRQWRDQIIYTLSKEKRLHEARKYTKYIDSTVGARPAKKLAGKHTSPEKAWFNRVDQFIEGLKDLGATKKLTPENVLTLANTPTAQFPYAVLGNIPARWTESWAALSWSEPRLRRGIEDGEWRVEKAETTPQPLTPIPSKVIIPTDATLPSFTFSETRNSEAEEIFEGKIAIDSETGRGRLASEEAVITPRFELIVLRHGQTEINKKHGLQGNTDLPINQLNPTGKRQAEEAAPSMMAILLPKILAGRRVVIVKSPLTRAQETAEPLVQALLNYFDGELPPNVEIVTDEEAGEIDFGILANYSKAEVPNKYQAMLTRYREGLDMTLEIPEGHSRLSFARTSKALLQKWNDLYDENTTVVYAGHGGRTADIDLLTNPEKLIDETGQINWRGKHEVPNAEPVILFDKNVRKIRTADQALRAAALRIYQDHGLYLLNPEVSISNKKQRIEITFQPTENSEEKFKFVIKKAKRKEDLYYRVEFKRFGERRAIYANEPSIYGLLPSARNVLERVKTSDDIPWQKWVNTKILTSETRKQESAVTIDDLKEQAMEAFLDVQRNMLRTDATRLSKVLQEVQTSIHNGKFKKANQALEEAILIFKDPNGFGFSEESKFVEGLRKTQSIVLQAQQLLRERFRRTAWRGAVVAALVIGGAVFIFNRFFNPTYGRIDQKTPQGENTQPEKELQAMGIYGKSQVISRSQIQTMVSRKEKNASEVREGELAPFIVIDYDFGTLAKAGVKDENLPKPDIEPLRPALDRLAQRIKALKARVLEINLVLNDERIQVPDYFDHDYKKGSKLFYFSKHMRQFAVVLAKLAKAEDIDFEIDYAIEFLLHEVGHLIDFRKPGAPQTIIVDPSQESIIAEKRKAFYAFFAEDDEQMQNAKKFVRNGNSELRAEVFRVSVDFKDRVPDSYGEERYLRKLRENPSKKLEHIIAQAHWDLRMNSFGPKNRAQDAHERYALMQGLDKKEKAVYQAAYDYFEAYLGALSYDASWVTSFKEESSQAIERDRTTQIVAKSYESFPFFFNPANPKPYYARSETRLLSESASAGVPASETRATKFQAEEKWLNMPLSEIPFRREIDFRAQPYGQALAEIGTGNFQEITLFEVLRAAEDSLHQKLLSILNGERYSQFKEGVAHLSEFLLAAKKIWDTKQSEENFAQAIDDLEQSLKAEGFFVDSPEAAAVLLTIQLPKENQNLALAILNGLFNLNERIKNQKPRVFSFFKALGLIFWAFIPLIIWPAFIEAVPKVFKASVTEGFMAIVFYIFLMGFSIFLGGVLIFFLDRYENERALAPYFKDYYEHFMLAKGQNLPRRKDLLELAIQDLKEGTTTGFSSLSTSIQNIFPTKNRLRYMERVLAFYSNRSESRASVQTKPNVQVKWNDPYLEVEIDGYRVQAKNVDQLNNRLNALPRHSLEVWTWSAIENQIKNNYLRIARGGKVVLDSSFNTLLDSDGQKNLKRVLEESLKPYPQNKTIERVINRETPLTLIIGEDPQDQVAIVVEEVTGAYESSLVYQDRRTYRDLPAVWFSVQASANYDVVSKNRFYRAVYQADGLKLKRRRGKARLLTLNFPESEALIVARNPVAKNPALEIKVHKIDGDRITLGLYGEGDISAKVLSETRQQPNKKRAASVLALVKRALADRAYEKSDKKVKRSKLKQAEVSLQGIDWKQLRGNSERSEELQIRVSQDISDAINLLNQLPEEYHFLDESLLVDGSQHWKSLPLQERQRVIERSLQRIVVAEDVADKKAEINRFLLNKDIPTPILIELVENQSFQSSFMRIPITRNRRRALITLRTLNEYQRIAAILILGVIGRSARDVLPVLNGIKQETENLEDKSQLHKASVWAHEKISSHQKSSIEDIPWELLRIKNVISKVRTASSSETRSTQLRLAQGKRATSKTAKREKRMTKAELLNLPKKYKRGEELEVLKTLIKDAKLAGLTNKEIEFRKDTRVIETLANVEDARLRSKIARKLVDLLTPYFSRELTVPELEELIAYTVGNEPFKWISKEEIEKELRDLSKSGFMRSVKIERALRILADQLDVTMVSINPEGSLGTGLGMGRPISEKDLQKRFRNLKATVEKDARNIGLDWQKIYKLMIDLSEIVIEGQKPKASEKTWSFERRDIDGVMRKVKAHIPKTGDRSRLHQVRVTSREGITTSWLAIGAYRDSGEVPKLYQNIRAKLASIKGRYQVRQKGSLLIVEPKSLAIKRAKKNGSTATPERSSFNAIEPSKKRKARSVSSDAQNGLDVPVLENELPDSDGDVDGVLDEFGFSSDDTTSETRLRSEIASAGRPVRLATKLANGARSLSMKAQERDLASLANRSESRSEVSAQEPGSSIVEQQATKISIQARSWKNRILASIWLKRFVRLTVGTFKMVVRLGIVSLGVLVFSMSFQNMYTPGEFHWAHFTFWLPVLIFLLFEVLYLIGDGHAFDFLFPKKLLHKDYQYLDDRRSETRATESESESEEVYRLLQQEGLKWARLVLVNLTLAAAFVFHSSYRDKKDNAKEKPAKPLTTLSEEKTRSEVRVSHTESPKKVFGKTKVSLIFDPEAEPLSSFASRSEKVASYGVEVVATSGIERILQSAVDQEIERRFIQNPAGMISEELVMRAMPQLMRMFPGNVDQAQARLQQIVMENPTQWIDPEIYAQLRSELTPQFFEPSVQTMLEMYSKNSASVVSTTEGVLHTLEKRAHVSKGSNRWANAAIGLWGKKEDWESIDNDAQIMLNILKDYLKEGSFVENLKLVIQDEETYRVFQKFFDEIEEDPDETLQEPTPEETRAKKYFRASWGKEGGREKVLTEWFSKDLEGFMEWLAYEAPSFDVAMISSWVELVFKSYNLTDFTLEDRAQAHALMAKVYEQYEWSLEDFESRADYRVIAREVVARDMAFEAVRGATLVGLDTDSIEAIHADVESANLQTPRHLFAPRFLHREAYEGGPLLIGQGEKLSETSPLTVALGALNVQENDHVKVVGAGTGYSSALISRLAGGKAKVSAYEINETLAERARRNISKIGFENVSIHEGDGVKMSSEEKPYNALVVLAGSPEDAPEKFSDQLMEGGKLIIPVYTGYDIDEKEPLYTLKLFEKKGDRLVETNTLAQDTRFSPLHGEVGWQADDEKLRGKNYAQLFMQVDTNEKGTALLRWWSEDAQSFVDWVLGERSDEELYEATASAELLLGFPNIERLLKGANTKEILRDTLDSIYEQTVWLEEAYSDQAHEDPAYQDLYMANEFMIIHLAAFIQKHYSKILEEVVGEEWQESLKKVEGAIRQIPRHLFAPSYLRAKENEEILIYQDRPQGIGQNQTISQPSLVAFMLTLLDLQGDEKVLDVGVGRGWSGALLSQLAQDVYATEIQPSLLSHAQRNQEKLELQNLHVLKANKDQLGHSEAGPYDAIAVWAGSAETTVHEDLARQLAEGGKLLIPLFDPDLSHKNDTTVYAYTLFTKENGELKEVRRILPTQFVPLILPDTKSETRLRNEIASAGRPVRPATKLANGARSFSMKAQERDLAPLVNRSETRVAAVAEPGATDSQTEVQLVSLANKLLGADGDDLAESFYFRDDLQDFGETLLLFLQAKHPWARRVKISGPMTEIDLFDVEGKPISRPVSYAVDQSLYERYEELLKNKLGENDEAKIFSVGNSKQLRARVAYDEDEGISITTLLTDREGKPLPPESFEVSQEQIRGDLHDLRNMMSFFELFYLSISDFEPLKKDPLIRKYQSFAKNQFARLQERGRVWSAYDYMELLVHIYELFSPESLQAFSQKLDDLRDTRANKASLAEFKRKVLEGMSYSDMAYLFAAFRLGHVTDKEEVFDVHRLLNRMINMRRISEKTIQRNFDSSEPLEVRANKLSIFRILLNLFENAIYSVTEAGKTEGKSIFIKTFSEDNSFVIEVRDEGIGIAPERLNPYSDDFILNRDVTDKGEKGTGLGLAISKELAESLGGELTVKSELGEGATFQIRLPKERLVFKVTHEEVRRKFNTALHQDGLEVGVIRNFLSLTGIFQEKILKELAEQMNQWIEVDEVIDGVSNILEEHLKYSKEGVKGLGFVSRWDEEQTSFFDPSPKREESPSDLFQNAPKFVEPLLGKDPLETIELPGSTRHQTGNRDFLHDASALIRIELEVFLFNEVVLPLMREKNLLKEANGTGSLSSLASERDPVPVSSAPTASETRSEKPNISWSGIVASYEGFRFFLEGLDHKSPYFLVLDGNQEVHFLKKGYRPQDQLSLVVTKYIRTAHSGPLFRYFIKGKTLHIQYINHNLGKKGFDVLKDLAHGKETALQAFSQAKHEGLALRMALANYLDQQEEVQILEAKDAEGIKLFKVPLSMLGFEEQETKERFMLVALNLGRRTSRQPNGQYKVYVSLEPSSTQNLLGVRVMQDKEQVIRVSDVYVRETLEDGSEQPKIYKEITVDQLENYGLSVGIPDPEGIQLLMVEPDSMPFLNFEEIRPPAAELAITVASKSASESRVKPEYSPAREIWFVDNDYHLMQAMMLALNNQAWYSKIVATGFVAEDFNFEIFSSVSAVLAAFEEAKPLPDLLITDLQMPIAGLDETQFSDPNLAGLHLAKHLHSQELSPPLILASDFYDRTIQKEVDQAIKDGILRLHSSEKPNTPEYIATILRNAGFLTRGEDVALKKAKVLVEAIQTALKQANLREARDVKKGELEELREALESPDVRHPADSSRDLDYLERVLADINRATELLKLLPKEFHPDFTAISTQSSLELPVNWATSSHEEQQNVVDQWLFEVSLSGKAKEEREDIFALMIQEQEEVLAHIESWFLEGVALKRTKDLRIPAAIALGLIGAPAREFFPMLTALRDQKMQSENKEEQRLVRALNWALSSITRTPSKSLNDIPWKLLDSKSETRTNLTGIQEELLLLSAAETPQPLEVEIKGLELGDLVVMYKGLEGIIPGIYLDSRVGYRVQKGMGQKLTVYLLDYREGDRPVFVLRAEDVLSQREVRKKELQVREKLKQQEISRAQAKEEIRKGLEKEPGFINVVITKVVTDIRAAEINPRTMKERPTREYIKVFEFDYKGVRGFVPASEVPRWFKKGSIDAIKLNMIGKTVPVARMFSWDPKELDFNKLALSMVQGWGKSQRLSEQEFVEMPLGTIVEVELVSVQHYRGGEPSGMLVAWNDYETFVPLGNIREVFGPILPENLIGKKTKAEKILKPTNTRFSLGPEETSEKFGFRLIKGEDKTYESFLSDLERKRLNQEWFEVAVMGPTRNYNGLNVLYKGQVFGFLPEHAIDFDDAEKQGFVRYDDIDLEAYPNNHLLKVRVVKINSSEKGRAFVQFSQIPERPETHKRRKSLKGGTSESSGGLLGGATNFKDLLEAQKETPPKSESRVDFEPGKVELGVHVDREQLFDLRVAVLDWDDTIQKSLKFIKNLEVEFFAKLMHGPTVSPQQKKSVREKIAGFHKPTTALFDWVLEDTKAPSTKRMSREEIKRKYVDFILKSLRDLGANWKDPDKLPLMEGVESLLESFKSRGLFRYVATNSIEETKIKVAALIGIEMLFDEIYGAESSHDWLREGDYSKNKILNHLITHHKIQPNQIALFEDTVGHVQNAKKIGAVTIGLADSAEKVEAFRAAETDIIIHGDFRNADQLVRHLVLAARSETRVFNQTVRAKELLVAELEGKDEFAFVTIKKVVIKKQAGTSKEYIAGFEFDYQGLTGFVPYSEIPRYLKRNSISEIKRMVVGKAFPAAKISQTKKSINWRRPVLSMITGQEKYKKVSEKAFEEMPLETISGIKFLSIQKDTHGKVSGMVIAWKGYRDFIPLGHIREVFGWVDLKSLIGKTVRAQKVLRRKQKFKSQDRAQKIPEFGFRLLKDRTPEESALIEELKLFIPDGFLEVEVVAVDQQEKGLGVIYKNRLFGYLDKDDLVDLPNGSELVNYKGRSLSVRIVEIKDHPDGSYFVRFSEREDFESPREKEFFGSTNSLATATQTSVPVSDRIAPKSETRTSDDRSAAQDNFWDKPETANSYAAFAANQAYASANQALIDLLDIKQGGFVLDLGSGTGAGSALVAKRVGQSGRVLGLDASQAMVDFANQKYAAEHPIEFQVDSAGNLNAYGEGQVDHVISFNAMHLLGDHEALFSKVYDKLKPGQSFGFNSTFFQQAIPQEAEDTYYKMMEYISDIMTEEYSERRLKRRQRTNFPNIEDYIAVAQAAGFTNISTEIKSFDLPIDNVEIFFQIPDIRKTLLRQGLSEEEQREVITEMFRRLRQDEIESLSRNWFYFIAEKPTLSETRRNPLEIQVGERTVLVEGDLARQDPVAIQNVFRPNGPAVRMLEEIFKISSVSKDKIIVRWDPSLLKEGVQVATWLPLNEDEPIVFEMNRRAFKLEHEHSLTLILAEYLTRLQISDEEVLRHIENDFEEEIRINFESDESRSVNLVSSLEIFYYAQVIQTLVDYEAYQTALHHALSYIKWYYKRSFIIFNFEKASITEKFLALANLFLFTRPFTLSDGSPVGTMPTQLKGFIQGLDSLSQAPLDFVEKHLEDLPILEERRVPTVAEIEADYVKRIDSQLFHNIQIPQDNPHTVISSGRVFIPFETFEEQGFVFLSVPKSSANIVSSEDSNNLTVDDWEDLVDQQSFSFEIEEGYLWIKLEDQKRWQISLRKDGPVVVQNDGHGQRFFLITLGKHALEDGIFIERLFSYEPVPQAEVIFPTSSVPASHQSEVRRVVEDFALSRFTLESARQVVELVRNFEMIPVANAMTKVAREPVMIDLATRSSAFSHQEVQFRLNHSDYVSRLSIFDQSARAQVKKAVRQVFAQHPGLDERRTFNFAFVMRYEKGLEEFLRSEVQMIAELKKEFPRAVEGNIRIVVSREEARDERTKAFLKEMSATGIAQTLEINHPREISKVVTFLRTQAQNAFVYGLEGYLEEVDFSLRPHFVTSQVTLQAALPVVSVLSFRSSMESEITTELIEEVPNLFQVYPGVLSVSGGILNITSFVLDFVYEKYEINELISTMA